MIGFNKLFLLTVLALSQLSGFAQSDSFYINKTTLEIVKDTTTLNFQNSFNGISFQTTENTFEGMVVILDDQSFPIKKDEHIRDKEYTQSHLVLPVTSFNSIKILSDKKATLKVIVQYVSPLSISVPKGRRSNCQHPSMVMQKVWRQGLPDPVSGRNKTETNHSIIHHSGGGNGNSDFTGLVRSYYIHHTQTNGWDDIGYNYLIANDGTLYAGRDPELPSIDQDNVQGAHYCGKNGGTMGVCLIGEFTTTQPSFASINTLTDLLTWKLDKEWMTVTDSFSHPKSTDPLLSVIDGHRVGCATECPGNLLFAHINKIRQDVYNKLDQCSSVGIDEIQKTLEVYPNPANNYFVIRTENQISGTVQITNIVGEKIFFKKFLNLSEIRVSTLNIANGIYHIEIQTNYKKFNRTITIQND